MNRPNYMNPPVQSILSSWWRDRLISLRRFHEYRWNQLKFPCLNPYSLGIPAFCTEHLLLIIVCSINSSITKWCCKLVYLSFSPEENTDFGSRIKNQKHVPKNLLTCKNCGPEKVFPTNPFPQLRVFDGWCNPETSSQPPPFTAAELLHHPPARCHAEDAFLHILPGPSGKAVIAGRAGVESVSLFPGFSFNRWWDRWWIESSQVAGFFYHLYLYLYIYI